MVLLIMSMSTACNIILCSLPSHGRLRTPSSPSGIATRGHLLSLLPDSVNTRARVSDTDVDSSRFDGICEVTRNGDREKQMEWLERELESETAQCVRDVKKETTSICSNRRSSRWKVGVREELRCRVTRRAESGVVSLAPSLLGVN